MSYIHITGNETDLNADAWPKFVGLEKYAMQIYRLQDEAGLTFREARAVLSPVGEAHALAKKWNVTAEAVYNLGRRGLKKIAAYTGNDPVKNEDLMPTLTTHVF